MALPATQPKVIDHDFGATSSQEGVHLGNDVWIVKNAGALVDGTSGDGAGWTGPGTLAIDYTNGKLYVNSNTKASPTWTEAT